MSVELILPRIDGVTTQQQLLQLKSCLFQMREQLQFALNNLDAGNFTQNGKEQMAQVLGGERAGAADELDTQYQELKALIIKTAHTVKLKYDEIVNNLGFEYVSNSEFGQYQEIAKSQITETAKNITQDYVLKTELDTALTDIKSYVTDTKAYIRTGHLNEGEEGTPIYGVEIGQKTTQIEDGKEVKEENLVSRFTSKRLSFYQGEAEVAYISNQRLYIIFFSRYLQ